MAAMARPDLWGKTTQTRAVVETPRQVHLARVVLAVEARPLPWVRRLTPRNGVVLVVARQEVPTAT